MNRCPHCRDRWVSLAVVFAVGVVFGAFLLAVGAAADVWGALP